MLSIVKKTLLLTTVLACSSPQAMSYEQARIKIEEVLFPPAHVHHKEKPRHEDTQIALAIHQELHALDLDLARYAGLPAPERYQKALNGIIQPCAWHAESSSEEINKATSVIIKHLETKALPRPEHRKLPPLSPFDTRPIADFDTIYPPEQPLSHRVPASQEKPTHKKTGEASSASIGTQKATAQQRAPALRRPTRARQTQ